MTNDPPSAPRTAPRSGQPAHDDAAYRFRIGRLDAVIVRDTPFELPLSAIGTNEDPDRVRRFFDEHQPDVPPGRLPMPVQILAVESGGGVVLFDAGTGEADERGRRLPDALEAVGIRPTDVRAVIVSHFHGDHLGGLGPADDPTFPNAEVRLPRLELQFLREHREEADVARALEQLRPALERDVVRLYDDGDELAPGVRAVAAHGHTPGHSAAVVESDGEALLYVADAMVNVAAGTRRPNWHMSLDRDPEEAVATRRALTESAAARAQTVFGYHFPFPGLGRFVDDGPVFRWEPAEV